MTFSRTATGWTFTLRLQSKGLSYSTDNSSLSEKELPDCQWGLIDIVHLTVRHQGTRHPELPPVIADLSDQKAGLVHQPSTKWKWETRHGFGTGPEGRNKLGDQVIHTAPTPGALLPAPRSRWKASRKVLMNSLTKHENLGLVYSMID